MFKNVAASFIVFAFDATTNVPKTGDAGNITAYVAKDYGTVTVLADTTATEMDETNAPGYYLFAAAQGETNGDCLLVSGKSATANIKVIGAPAIIYTRPTTGWLAPTVAARTLDVSATGEAGIDWANVGSPTTANALTATTIATTQKVDVDTIKTNPVVNGGTVTFPTNATLASTTGAVGSVTGAVGLVTGLTASDVGAIKAKTDNLPSVAAGAANGILISGANTGPMSISGGVSYTNSSGDAFTLTSSGGNGNGLKATGNGSGDGFAPTGGATGRGIHATGGATSGAGFRAEASAGNGPGIHGVGFGTGPGIEGTGGDNGPGVHGAGGAVSGEGAFFEATGGGAGGDGLKIAGIGTSKHGIVVTGGTAGVSDGFKAVAGTGGVPIRGNITGDITGNLSGSIGSYTGNTPQTANVATLITTVGAAGAGLTAVKLAAAGLDSVILTELAAVPSAAAKLVDAICWLFMALRNRRETTATADKIENDAGAAIATAVLSDDGTTFTKGEYA